MENWIRELVYAVRSLSASKKFVATVVATLALGIGANAAVFSVLHAVVLQPLPYDEPDKLVRIHHRNGGEDGYLPGLALIEHRDQSRTLDIAGVYTYSVEGVDLTDRGQPERVQSLQVSADYFRVLRVSPLAGRVFERADEVPNARVAVIGERLWREYLGGAPDAAGRSLSLNGIPYRVTAVLPAGFRDPLMPDVEIWAALNTSAAARTRGKTTT